MSHEVVGANMSNATAHRVYDEHVSSVEEALPDRPEETQTVDGVTLTANDKVLLKNLYDNNLTVNEFRSVLIAIRGSVDLYRGYVKLRPESPKMKRKQAVLRKRLIHLASAKRKLTEAWRTRAEATPA